MYLRFFIFFLSLFTLDRNIYIYIYIYIAKDYKAVQSRREKVFYKVSSGVRNVD